MRGFLILLVSVFAAIGIGVGIESASTPTAYGPPGTRFYAAFPGTPSMQERNAPAAHVRRVWTFTGTSDDAQLVVSAVLLTHVPANEAVSVFVSTRQRRTPTVPLRDLRMTPTTVAGQPATLFAGCLGRAPAGRDRCTGTLSISPSGSSSHRIEWSAEASASSPAQVKQLLASFLPAAG